MLDRKRICVVTATRAEYGLLKPLIYKLNQENLDVRLVVTGAHLSSEFGLTYKEIEDDGLKIDRKIDILLSSDRKSAMSKTMALALMGFSDYFETEKPELVILLGDRYETMAVAIAAMNNTIPIAHLCGGEITEGAVDDAIRHAITKMSYLHFASTEVYKNRIIQLGESPSRVLNVGALGVENILNEKLLTKSEMEMELGIDLDKPYAIVTYHPVTLEEGTCENQIVELLDACLQMDNMNFIFTKANADAGGRLINEVIAKYAESNEEIILVDSLGMKRYLSSLKYAKFVMGNSSSGIIEVPSFKIPTINIGDRQKGRIQCESIINVAPEKDKIINAMNKALDVNFIQNVEHFVSPYGNGNTSKVIVKTIVKYFESNHFDMKKCFYDMAVRV